ncbi:DUF1203 domain-containing protein [Tateyamaria sp.]|uniref:DUF1203 domain-containing protein n=1 Tax=Tateyamaria sp. TaxID=1929288 RepID=UPI00329E816B
MFEFSALPSDVVKAYRSGGLDAFGNPPETAISDGTANPCRHCLRNIPKGAGMLILAHKPFEGTHPYAEVGPIFLCVEDCAQGGGTAVPDVLTTSPDYLVKGYSAHDRIVYGTGVVAPTDELEAQLAAIFTNPDVAYIHVRSARNNCYQARVDRGG